MGDEEALQNLLIYPDSSFIASGKYHKEWRPVGNRQEPVPLTVAEIQEIGHKANENLRAVRADPLAFNNRGASVNILPAWEAPGVPDEAKDYLKGIWYQKFWFSAGSVFTRGRNSQGALQVFFSSPLDFGPGGKYGGSRLLGGINLNLIYRIYTGGKFKYLNIGGSNVPGRGPN